MKPTEIHKSCFREGGREIEREREREREIALLVVLKGECMFTRAGLLFSRDVVFLEGYVHEVPFGSFSFTPNYISKKAALEIDKTGRKRR